jgi:putative ABC transport system permease protein
MRAHSEQWLTVVGVVADTRPPRSSTPPQPVLYQPFSQRDSTAMMRARMLQEDASQGGTRQWLGAAATDLTLAIRTSVPPGSLASAVRGRVAAIDPDLAVFDLATMEERLAQTVATERFNMILLGSLAAVALLLAVVGVYGVTDYGVRRRTHEIGVRVALGAAPEQILRMVLLQTARAATLGLLIGGVAAFFLTRFLKALLFGIGVRDPFTLAVAAAIVFFVSLLAGYLPSRRALRVDPALALRHE